MFKKKEVTVATPAVVQLEDNYKETPVEYTSQGFSMIRHPDNNGFALVTVAFNPVTMDAKVTEVKLISENRDDAEFYFKVRMGEYFSEQQSRS